MTAGVGERDGGQEVRKMEHESGTKRTRGFTAAGAACWCWWWNMPSDVG